MHLIYLYRSQIQLAAQQGEAFSLGEFMFIMSCPTFGVLPQSQNERLN